MKTPTSRTSREQIPAEAVGATQIKKKNLVHLEAQETLRESAVVNTMQTPPAPSLPPQNDPHAAVTYIVLPSHTLQDESTALAPRSTSSQHCIISGPGSPRSNYCRQLYCRHCETVVGSEGSAIIRERIDKNNNSIRELEEDNKRVIEMCFEE